MDLRQRLFARPAGLAVSFDQRSDPDAKQDEGQQERHQGARTLGLADDACRTEAERSGVCVAQAGFLDQAALGRAYAAADCLVLPSTSETWGLVVNEALATGLPAIVSSGVGCAPDLVTPGVTGEVFPCGDVGSLASALARVRDRLASRRDFTAACRARAATHSFAAATAGLVEACRAVAGRGGAHLSERRR